MSDYRFTFGYLALKMLGKTLYSNPFAALSELIANGIDANASKIWVYIDIREKSKSEIVVIDNGCGMSDKDVTNKYLIVGKNNRPNQDEKMMGRKGIGKLAAFYLSNKYYLVTKTLSEENIFEIDFTLHENGTKNENDDTYMKKVSKFNFPYDSKYNDSSSGTAIYLTNVNFVGYGEKSFDVLESELAELFLLKDNTKKIYLKIVRSDSDFENEFVCVKKKIAFKNMSKILYNLDDSEFSNVLALNGHKIENAEKLANETTVLTNVERYDIEPIESFVNGKSIKINPKGWVGLHQTINRDLAHKNDPDNFINSKFYNFNKIRVYVRGKLALENILPYVHNTQYYVNYIEKTQDSVKTNYIIFLSHKRDDKYISDFIYNYLTTICGFEESLIFYTSKSGGIDESVENLEKQINSAYLDYVCVEENGKIIYPDHMTKKFADLLKEHGLKHIRLHDLRHSCASNMLASGVPMKEIQEWLGHSNFSTTADVYSHLDFSAKIRAAKTISSVYDSGEKPVQTAVPTPIEQEPMKVFADAIKEMQALGIERLEDYLVYKETGKFAKRPAQM